MTCRKCGKPLEVTLLYYTGKDRMGLTPHYDDCHSLTRCCPNRCDVDMTCHREATPEEKQRWGKYWDEQRNPASAEGVDVPADGPSTSPQSKPAEGAKAPPETGATTIKEGE